MNRSEEAHRLTEKIYQNLSEHFNPAVKQILSCAKVYHKALLGASAAARSYIESLGRLGHHCKNNGQGGTEEIGEAIFRVAEVQKEIQLRFEDCSKSFFAEVVLPLEQKIENEFRNAVAEHKKYQSGHKRFLVPFSKASESLKKFHKKKKSKLGFSDSKELQLMRTLDRCTEKLNEFRLQGLKLALLEERKCYCFILSRLCALGSTQMHYHDRGMELLSGQLGSWRQLCSQPNILPRSADVLFHIVDKQCPDQMNSSSSYGVYMPESVSSSGSSGHSPLHHSHTPNMQRPGPLSEYALPESPSQSLPRSVAMSMSTPPSGPPPEPPVGPQVQAAYTHVPQQDFQLAFNVGDLITLLGEQVDGWQFGHNLQTGMYGWFPLSFTDRLDQSRLPSQTPIRLRQRAKSVSDFSTDALSLCDLGGWSFEHDIRTQRRPRSLHEFSIASAPGRRQLHGGGGSQYFFDDTSSVHSSATGFSSYMHDPLVPSSQLVHGSVISRGDGDVAKFSPLSRSPSMKSLKSLYSASDVQTRPGILPPPPTFSPPPPPAGEGASRQHASPPVPPPPPPPLPPPPLPKATPRSSSAANASLSSIASQAASVASSMRNNVSQKLRPLSSIHQPGKNLPSVPSRPASGNTQDSTANTRQSNLIRTQGHHPTSSPPAPPLPPPPADGDIERDNFLKSVTLRKTTTNDRSGPRIT